MQIYIIFILIIWASHINLRRGGCGGGLCVSKHQNNPISSPGQKESKSSDQPLTISLTQNSENLSHSPQGWMVSHSSPLNVGRKEVPPIVGQQTSFKDLQTRAWRVKSSCFSRPGNTEKERWYSSFSCADDRDIPFLKYPI